MADSERPTANSPSFEIPDLELEPVRPLIQPAQPRPEQVQEQVPGAGWVLESFDADPFEGELPSLDLDVEPRPHTDPESSRATLPLDPSAVLALAGYGEPPRAVQLTPGYALRVFLRQRVLKRQLRALDAELARAAADRETALVELGRRLFETVRRLPAFSAHVAAISELDRAPGHGEHATRQRRALAELARAALAERGLVEIPADWLEAAQRAREHAEQRNSQREMLARASVAYDLIRVRQGVRLAFTLVLLLIVLLSLKFTL